MLPRYPRQNTKSAKPLCAYNFIICQRIGRPPISTMGLGRYSVSSRKRVPSPPHSITTFTKFSWQALAAGSSASFPNFIVYSDLRQGRTLHAYHGQHGANFKLLGQIFRSQVARIVFSMAG